MKDEMMMQMISDLVLMVGVEEAMVDRFPPPLVPDPSDVEAGSVSRDGGDLGLEGAECEDGGLGGARPEGDLEAVVFCQLPSYLQEREREYVYVCTLLMGYSASVLPALDHCCCSSLPLSVEVILVLTTCSSSINYYYVS
jgi:hypothetical protein